MNGQIGNNLNVIRDSGFYSLKGDHDGIAYDFEVLDSVNSVNLAEKYAGGAVGVIIHLNVSTGRNCGNFNGVANSTDISVPFHSKKGHPVTIKDLERRMRCRSKDWHDGSVFVGVVQRIESIKHIPLPIRKALKIDKHQFNPLTRSSDAIAGGFEGDSISPNWKLCVPVLFSAVNPHDFPHHMVQSASKIVDSVAYYDRKFIGDIIDKSYLDYWLASFLVVLDTKSVRLPIYEGFELPFDVGNVSFCSLNF